jgi:hypothetical protein
VRLRHPLSFGEQLVLFSIRAGCGGPSADEWRRSQDEVATLKAQLDATQKQHAEDEGRVVEAQSQIRDLEEKLREFVSQTSSKQTQCEAMLLSCQSRDCASRGIPSSPTTTWSTSDSASSGLSTGGGEHTQSSAPAGPTIPYPGNGAGPTLCADGSVSGGRHHH